MKVQEVIESYMTRKEMERANRKRMSKDPSPDRNDADIMNYWTGVSQRAKQKRDKKRNRRHEYAWDNVSVVKASPDRLRWAK